jgi:hypothetical protein
MNAGHSGLEFCQVAGGGVQPRRPLQNDWEIEGEVPPDGGSSDATADPRHGAPYPRYIKRGGGDYFA